MAANARAAGDMEGHADGGGARSTSVASGAFGPLDVSWAARAGGGPDGKTSPEELIAAAHAACFSMALSERCSPRRATARATRDLGDRDLRPGRDHQDRPDRSAATVPGSTPTASERRRRRRSTAARSRRRWRESRRSRSTPRSRSDSSSTASRPASCRARRGPGSPARMRTSTRGAPRRAPATARSGLPTGARLRRYFALKPCA